MLDFRWRTLFLLSVLVITSFGQSLPEQAYQAYQQKDFSKAAQLYSAAIKAGDQDLNTFYNGACSYSLVGKKNEAFDLLQQLLQRGWADVGQLKQDDDLKNLREDARWQPLVDKCEAAQKRQTAFWSGKAFTSTYRENLSDDEKVAGLSKIWSEARFGFANFDLIPELDWDKLYIETLPKIRQTKTTTEYYRLLLGFIAHLKDGHSNVSLPGQLADELNARPLIVTRLIEDKVIVRRVFDEKLQSGGLVSGVEVVAIDGVPVKQYAAEQVAPFMSASTPHDLNVRTYEYALLGGSVQKTIELTLRDAAGKEFKQTMVRIPNGDRAKYLPRGAASFEFKVLPGNIGYIALNQFENDEVVKEFTAKFAEIAKTDALIFDVRNNGGGNSGNGWDILSCLTDKSFQTSRWRTRSYRPTYRAWGTPEGWYEGGAGERKPNGPMLYTKPVAVLISPRTYSAAEDFAVAFDVMQRGKLIGETTGGSTGQPLSFMLPGGGSARICTKRDTYPDGREFVGVGVQPHIAVAPTVADFRATRDTVLEAALADLQKTLKK